MAIKKKAKVITLIRKIPKIIPEGEKYMTLIHGSASELNYYYIKICETIQNPETKALQTVRYFNRIKNSRWGDALVRLLVLTSQSENLPAYATFKLSDFPNLAEQKWFKETMAQEPDILGTFPSKGATQSQRREDKPEIKREL